MLAPCLACSSCLLSATAVMPGLARVSSRALRNAARMQLARATTQPTIHMRAHKAPPSRKSRLQSSTTLHANTPHTPIQHPPLAPPSRYILREKGYGGALCCWRANQSAGILLATAAKLIWATMLALLLCSFCLRTLLPWIGPLECGSSGSPEHPWGEVPTCHFFSEVL